MLARLGFVASVLSEDLSTSRTCRLRNATGERIRELASANLAALDRVISFLERHDVGLYRISSNLVPFASHAVNTVRWWEEYDKTLSELGRRIRNLGIRVSTHPGQYTVLNSPDSSIVRASVAELVYHARLLDALNVDCTCKIIVHVGGLYGGTKREAMARFAATAKGLPRNVLRRLVLENDDRLFDADDVLQLAGEVDVPMVFDWLHHQANPCRRVATEVLPEIFSTWRSRDGTPKVHLSSQAKGRPPGCHADYIDQEDVLAFLRVAPGQPFDCMLEAKQKDRALLRLRGELEQVGIVETHRLAERIRTE
jgi:UV DNA damage endonuclease